MIIHSILVQMPTKTEWFKKREGRRRTIEKEKEVESLTHHMLSTFLSIVKEEKNDWKHHGKWIDHDVYKCKKFRYKC